MEQSNDDKLQSVLQSLQQLRETLANANIDASQLALLGEGALGHPVAAISQVTNELHSLLMPGVQNGPTAQQVVDTIDNAAQPPLSAVKPQLDTASPAVGGPRLANENQVVAVPSNGQHDEEAGHELAQQQQQQQEEAPASLIKAVAATVVDAPQQQQPNNLSGEAREKLVMVPTRKRTVRGGGGGRGGEPLSSQDPNVIDPSAAAIAAATAGGASFRRVELPATPFGLPPPDTAEKAYGPNPTPGGLPATTPIAAEVLASLNLAAAAAGFAFPPPSQYPLSAQQQQQQQEQEQQQLYNSYQQQQAMYGFPSYAHGNAPLHKMNLATNHVGTERMPCKCKRSQCLKLYCDCFAAGGFCMPGCICAGCRNTIKYTRMVQNARKIVLAKDPHAFQIKIGNEGHKKGCRCKRSRCLKKYCECFLAGSKCNPDTCICEGCLNMEFPRDEPDAPDVADTWTIPAVGGLGEPSGAAMAAGMVAAGMQQQAAAMFAAEHQAQYAAAAAAAAANASTPPIPMFDPMVLSTLMAGLPLNGVVLNGNDAYTNLPDGVTPPLPQMYQTMAAFRAAAAEYQGMPAEVAMAKGMPALSSFMMSQGGGGQKQQIEGDEQQQEQQEQQQLLQQLSFALVSHLSEAAANQQTAGPETADTATSPGSNASDMEAAMKKRQLDYISDTLTGGSKAAAGSNTATTRPLPIPYSNSMVMMMANKALLAQQAAAAGGGGGVSLSTAPAVVPEERSKRPKRAASGGVMGAVAAETSDWGLDLVSPPLRKTTSLPPPAPGAGNAAGGRGSKQQPHERVALLKDALHRETARSQKEQKNIAAAAAFEAGNSGEDEADAVSALFELCSSQF